MKHAFLAPSSAGIWGPTLGCHAYPFIVQRYEEQIHAESEEGNAVHWLGANMLRVRVGQSPDKFPLRTDKLIAPNSVRITDDMYDRAQVYARDVVVIFEKYKRYNPEVFIEQYRPLPDIHKECGGTADCVILIRPLKLMFIWDYKNGFVPVEPKDNYQTTCYFTGYFDGNGADDQEWNVSVRIVQPRSYDHDGPVKNWTGKAHELRPIINTLKRSAEAVFAGNPSVRSGKHCHNCPARFECQMAIKSGLNLYEVSGKIESYTVNPDPQTLSTNLTIVSEAYKRLGKIKEALETEAEMKLKANGVVPGYYLEDKYSGLKWSVDTDAVIALGQVAEVNLKKPDAVMTPLQAITAGVSEDLVKSCSKSYRTGVKLVPENINKLKRIYGI